GPRLVRLDGEDVVAAPLDDLLGQVALAEGGVADYDLAPQRQDAQQAQGRLVLVGPGAHAQLAEDGLGLGGVGGHQVLAGDLPLAAAARGLAVQRQHRGAGGQAGGGPARQALLQGGVQPAQQAGEGGLGGPAAAGEAEGQQQGRPVVAAEPGDGVQALAAQEEAEGDEGEYGGEREALAVRAAGVGEGGEGFRERQRGHGKASVPGNSFSPRSRLPRRGQDQTRNGPAAPESRLDAPPGRRYHRSRSC